MTVTYNTQQIKRGADNLEKQLRLIMHGVPLELVDKATANQLAVMEEIVNRDIIEQIKIKAVATNNGIATVFGADK